jgi:peptidoglycan lytic transglycosylase G
MFRKLLKIVVLIVIITGGIIVWSEYRAYQRGREARLQRLQLEAQEVQATTIEGWTAKDIALELEKKKLFPAQEFLKAQSSFDPTAYPLVKNNLPKNADSLEGFLFPDTYRFGVSAAPDAVIGKMLSDFTERTAKIGVSADRQKYPIPGYEQYPLTFYQVLTMASIIEKESGGKGPVPLDQERAMVAGVFYNRLALGQPLQSDATVNYATGKSSASASAQDLTINSPYNTYKYPGLPPGPICNPSLSSIYAALHPAKNDYYYFFHKQPGGEVVFSKTFSEHKRKMQEQ